MTKSNIIFQVYISVLAYFAITVSLPYIVYAQIVPEEYDSYDACLEKTGDSKKVIVTNKNPRCLSHFFDSTLKSFTCCGWWKVSDTTSPDGIRTVVIQTY